MLSFNNRKNNIVFNLGGEGKIIAAKAELKFHQRQLSNILGKPFVMLTFGAIKSFFREIHTLGTNFCLP